MTQSGPGAEGSGAKLLGQSEDGGEQDRAKEEDGKEDSKFRQRPRSRLQLISSGKLPKDCLRFWGERDRAFLLLPLSVIC